MTYFLLQNTKGERIGEKVYMEHSGARRVAVRLAGKWAKSNDLRGSAIKIIQEDGSIYGSKVVEWINT